MGEFIITDLGGLHNSDMEASSARIMKGGSWKKQRILVLLPAATMISTKVALSHWNLAFPPNNGVVRILCQGMEVGDAYSSAIENILKDPNLSQWEYVLTIEHDNLPPSDGVIKLVEDLEQHPELSAVGGAYWTKGPGGVFQAWGDVSDPVLNFRPQLPRTDGGLLECCGTGMGFNLWRLSMFKDTRFKRPLFLTQTKGGMMTQDLYFWQQARPLGYRCAIDCSVKVGHMDVSGEFGEREFVW